MSKPAKQPKRSKPRKVAVNVTAQTVLTRLAAIERKLERVMAEHVSAAVLASATDIASSLDTARELLARRVAEQDTLIEQLRAQVFDLKHGPAPQATFAADGAEPDPMLRFSTQTERVLNRT